MAQKSFSTDIHGLQNIRTPFQTRLCGIYKRSFAYTTIKDRLPIILTKIIDTISRNKELIVNMYGNEAAEELKQITGAISKLKNEIVTNKVLLPLNVKDDAVDDDAMLWNEYLEEKIEIEESIPTWFNTPWLYCECYMYRRIAQIFLLTRTLQEYDPFEEQKKDNFIGSSQSILKFTEYLLPLLNQKHKMSDNRLKEEYCRLLELNLWGNRCDMSLSAGAKSIQIGNPIELFNIYKQDILINDSECVWNILNKQYINNLDIVDIVLDNSGYELFTDICLAAFLTTQEVVKKFRFYVKRYPWYVSDVTVKDFHWLVQYMVDSLDSNLQKLGNIVCNYLKEKIWSIEEESYWTEPREFVDMEKYDRKLYEKLSLAKLIIFKGDLNYRKLLGDINFEHSTNFDEALRNFHPSQILSLRTVKSDVCVGLPPGKSEELFNQDEYWMITGQYGLIQSTKMQCSYNW